MAVIISPNASSVKITFDCGTDLEGKKVTRVKTLGSIKSTASNDDILAVVNSITSLQQHGLYAINRIDNSSISE